jgi:hypothetical protein
MDRYTALVAIGGMMLGAFTIACITWVIVAAITKRKRGADALPEASVGRIEERLSRMEQAIEAVAIEVERVAEGQRFTTKLLSEKRGEPVLERRP